MLVEMASEWNESAVFALIMKADAHRERFKKLILNAGGRPDAAFPKELEELLVAEFGASPNATARYLKFLRRTWDLTVEEARGEALFDVVRPYSMKLQKYAERHGVPEADGHVPDDVAVAAAAEFRLPLEGVRLYYADANEVRAERRAVYAQIEARRAEIEAAVIRVMRSPDPPDTPEALAKRIGPELGVKADLLRRYMFRVGITAQVPGLRGSPAPTRAKK